jgi:hypothetical protein
LFRRSREYREFGVLGRAIEEFGNVRMQSWLVLFDGEHVVRFAIHDFCCNTVSDLGKGENPFLKRFLESFGIERRKNLTDRVVRWDSIGKVKKGLL